MGSIRLKECNGAVLNRLKIISGLGPSISPSGQQGPILSPLGSLICPLHHQRSPKLLFHCFDQGPNFLFSLSGHLAQFSHCFIKGFSISPLHHKRAKGLKFSIASSRAPNFLIMLGRDKIIVWFRLHTAQKVGSVGRENILFWTKILMSPVIINRVKWCKIRKSDITHTHTHMERS